MYLQASRPRWPGNDVSVVVDRVVVADLGSRGFAVAAKDQLALAAVAAADTAVASAEIEAAVAAEALAVGIHHRMQASASPDSQPAAGDDFGE